MIKNTILKQNRKDTQFEIECKGKKYIAIINTSDFKSLPNIWITMRSDKQKYLCLFIDGRLQYLHRYINQTTRGFVTDHINGNVLDNRRTNLQTLTQSQNTFKQKSRNRKLPRGVCKDNGLYRAQIVKNRKHIYIGTYNDPDIAHQAYMKFAETLFGRL